MECIDFFDKNGKIVALEKMILCPYCRSMTPVVLFLAQQTLLEGRYAPVLRMLVSDYGIGLIQEMRNHFTYLSIGEGSQGQVLKNSCVFCRATLKVNLMDEFAKEDGLNQLLAMDNAGEFIFELDEHELDALAMSCG